MWKLSNLLIIVYLSYTNLVHYKVLKGTFWVRPRLTKLVSAQNVDKLRYSGRLLHFSQVVHLLPGGEQFVQHRNPPFILLQYWDSFLGNDGVS